MQKKLTELRFWLKQALWFVPFAYFLNFIYAVYSDQSGGTFGDTFGAANALFSGTALLLLVLAVSLQREELEHVKKERNDTLKLLEGQEGINEAQRVALEKQLFESSFFSLFSMINEEKARLLEQEGAAGKETVRLEQYRRASECLLEKKPLKVSSIPVSGTT
ncbi:MULTISPECIES: hypothetical protein [unclassified Ruegeria]|uniref:hypothetical protein n=1 Tax=unclassified Ruegeria TaxID=2625375 RepID=UPI00148992D7|nr:MULTISPECIES: hypothetical protein [unclassified Ruegeria]NOD35046.1 hypothetical protein [Ruegeria sp. HKCCD7296]NOD69004.1 hypothetical protein [Ruegeria sp. HKCCD7303]NOE35299.1 hypothetical protein [Ruegeria sp. HKCCD7318]NOE41977.1 hypothetical protein [Ruegeria sp. HKCCD7319]